jgi:hypothetical protein
MNKKLFFAASLGFLLAACSTAEEYEKEPIPVRITAGLGTTNARSVDQNWNSDVIGVSVISDTYNTMTNETNTNVQYKTDSRESTATFTPVSSSILFNAGYEGSATFAAYAPYTASVTGGAVNINTQQNNDTQENQEKNLDFLFATGASASFASPNVVFEGSHAFVHKMIQLNLYIKTVKTDDLTVDISSATDITLGGLIHTGTINITTGEISTSGETVSSWSILKQYHTDSDVDQSRTYSLIVLPQSLTDALTLSVTIQGKTYTNKTIKPDLTKNGRAYNYMISVQGNGGIKVEGSTITAWDKQDYEEGNAYQE